jgi:hypothetical protein
VLRTDGFKLRAQHRYAGLAVEHARDAHGLEPGAVALPLDALADLEGRDETTVTLEAAAPDRTVARWHDRGIPQSREFEVVPLERLTPFPELPDQCSDAPAGLLDALAEASAVACHGSTRYALGCDQIPDRDGGHQVIATDDCQLLVQGGFALPWQGDVLVNRTPLFASWALPRDPPVLVGRTETHVVFRVGPWTVALEVWQGDRFPDVDRVLPAEGGDYTRLAIDPDGAVFLRAALERLPGVDEPNAPVTVDLNGRVAVRARGPGGVTEPVLSRSGYAGPPKLAQVNRRFLAASYGSGSTCWRSPAAPTPWSAATGIGSTPGSRSRPTRPSGRRRTSPGSSPSRPARARRGGSQPRTKGAPWAKTATADMSRGPQPRIVIAAPPCRNRPAHRGCRR